MKNSLATLIHWLTPHCLMFYEFLVIHVCYSLCGELLNMLVNLKQQLHFSGNSSLVHKIIVIILITNDVSYC